MLSPLRLFPVVLSVLLVMGCLTGCDSTEPGEPGAAPPTPPEPVAQSYPRWSPDGEKILYYDDGLVYDAESDRIVPDPDRRGLWTMRPDGTNQRQVLTGPSIYGDWSPDGDSLVFEAGGAIYKAAFADGVVDTASVARLSPPGRRCFFPDWNSVGGEILYHNTNCGTNAEPTPDSCGIFMVTNEGDQPQRVISGRHPEWSPDGKSLYYLGLRREVFNLELGEERPKRLTSLNQDDPYAAQVRYPRISPSGEEIAVQVNGQVWLMKADGTEIRELTDISRPWLAAGQPDWSPRGDRIVYVGPEHTIWMMDADGTDKRQVTTLPDGSP